MKETFFAYVGHDVSEHDLDQVLVSAYSLQMMRTLPVARVLRAMR